MMSKLMVFRLIAAVLTTVLAVGALIDSSVLEWYYGWLVLWLSAIPSWFVVWLLRRRISCGVQSALAHDLFLLWAAVVVIPGLPNMFGVVMLWYLVAYWVEGVVLLLTHQVTSRRPSARAPERDLWL